jgi:glycerol-3-phosphate dehydrogenase (NAD(P)+)
MLPEKIAVIGGGSWGTTLAGLLAGKGHEVTLWVFEADLASRMSGSRVNDLYLPDYRLPDNLTVTSDLNAAARDKDIALIVTPSHVTRGILTMLAPGLKEDASLVCATKGIENETLMTMAEMMEDVLPKGFHGRLAYLSGPSFAREVCRNMPTAVSIASKEPAVARRMQDAFNTDYFRVYTNPDVTGVELGGSIKNVIAIASGCSDGLGFGHNTRAALITRGLAEIARLGIAMGANPLTFSGLSGMGDLVLTCTGELSRNRSVGYKLGGGMKLPEVLGEMKMVAEGVKTAKAAYELAKKHGVVMPITEQVYRLLYEDKEPRQVVRELMTRELKGELG